MAGFTSKSVKTRTQRAFRDAGTNQNANRRQSIINRLVDVLEVHPSADGKGTVLVKDKNPDTGAEFVFKVRVSDETIKGQKARDQAKPEAVTEREWIGSYVDEKFAKRIEVGGKIILENSVITGQKYKEGDKEILPVDANWIHNVTEPAEDKTFKAIVTAEAYDHRLRSLQCWRTTAVSAADAEGIKALVESMNEVIEKRNEGVLVPNIGVRFRTLIANPADNGETYQVKDSSTPFDYVVGEEEGDKGHPLDGESFVSLVNEYVEYILGPQDQPEEGKFYAEGLKEEDIIIEVMSYVNYFASPKSKSMQVREDLERSANYRLANTPIKNAIDDERPSLGKNLAYTGVMMLSGDKYDKKTKTETPRYLAVRFFPDSISGNILSFVRAFDGKKCVPHEALQVPRREKVEGQGVAGAASSSDSTVHQSAQKEEAALSAPLSQPDSNDSGSFQDGFADLGFDEGDFASFGAETPEETKEDSKEESKDESAGKTSRFSF